MTRSPARTASREHVAPRIRQYTYHNNRTNSPGAVQWTAGWSSDCPKARRGAVVVLAARAMRTVTITVAGYRDGPRVGHGGGGRRAAATAAPAGGAATAAATTRLIAVCEAAGPGVAPKMASCAAVGREGAVYVAAAAAAAGAVDSLLLARGAAVRGAVAPRARATVRLLMLALVCAFLAAPRSALKATALGKCLSVCHSFCLSFCLSVCKPARVRSLDLCLRHRILFLPRRHRHRRRRVVVGRCQRCGGVRGRRTRRRWQ